MYINLYYINLINYNNDNSSIVTHPKKHLKNNSPVVTPSKKSSSVATTLYFPVSELLPNALKSQCTPSFQTYAFFSKPFDLKAFLYFVARSYVLASAVARYKSNFTSLVFFGVPYVRRTSTHNNYQFL